MPPLLAVTCRHCKAALADDARTCTNCGEAAPVEIASAQMLLVLPGSPAFSADLHRTRRSVIPAASAGVLALIVVGVAFWTMPNAADDAPPRTTVASGPRTTETYPVVDAADASVFTSKFVPSQASVDSLAPVPGVEPSSAPPTDPKAGDPMRFSSLRVSPLASNSLRIGEQVRLRWSVRTLDDSGMVLRVRFASANATIASVSPRSGVITARAPGRARIIVDAGDAGTRVLTLDVRGPATSLVFGLPPESDSDAARAILVRSRTSIEPQQAMTSSGLQATAPRPSTPALLRQDSAAARAASRMPSASAAASAPSATPAASAVGAAGIDLPTSAEIRSVAEKVVANVRSGGVRNFDVMEFLDYGAEHRVTLASTPVTTSVTTYSVRVTFTIRLTKYDAGGRPVTRIAPVTMDVDKRDRALMASAVTIGAIRRP